MKVAIIAPSGVPFIWGGAENIWKVLWLTLNQQENITAELIKLPSPEHDFWAIIQSYQNFAELDLNHFDLIISTKYPAWMVSHPRHILFMQHTLRGLYDTYPAHLTKNIDHLAQKLPALCHLLNIKKPNRTHLSECFVELKRIKELQILNQQDIALPGPLLRALIHFFDAVALAPGQILRYTAIAHEVANRKEYFPGGIKPDVLYHPSSLPQAGVIADTHISPAIFTASRLDGPKRIDLLIKAYCKSGVKTPLRIAGTGPQSPELQKLIPPNAAITLLGHLSEQQLAQEYANALFVPFIPEHEDFGLISYEAMIAGKAVLSCTDSGGATELIRHMENGLIVKPDCDEIAKAIKQLSDHPSLSHQLGQKAYNTVKDINWPALVKELLNKNAQYLPKILVLNTYPIYPVVSGGQARLYHLYSELSMLGYSVEILNLDFNTRVIKSRNLNENFIEVLIPVSDEFRKKSSAEEKRLNISCVDWLAAAHPELLPEWQAEIKRRAPWASMVICSHPYAYPAMVQAGVKQWLYEAHNVEADLKSQIYRQHPNEAQKIKELESQCAIGAQHIICCSNEDSQRMQALYQIPDHQFSIIANGVDTQNIKYLDQAGRKEIRVQMGLEPTNNISLFMGSNHGPNIEAAEQILIAAEQDLSLQYIILGSVADAFKQRKIPNNVRFLGVVSQAEKQLWLKIASIALNPMLNGSGSNLKLIEYAAAGLPIISTEFGVRGTKFEAGVHYIKTHNFTETIKKTLKLTDIKLDQITRKTAEYINNELYWKSLAEKYQKEIKASMCKAKNKEESIILPPSIPISSLLY
ncbi:glycosyltransferase family 4 protein [Iodobacter fluviatilis]|uniref:Glycosyltransferase involved in cell wall biosynthesis n=1 Tax=Iodobacter fluviatilis TaxID=537 RepID=A0A377SYA8_9NEIS|nr:glycosyltransferase [Iodobacter fluviatilis]TCU87988.1 glycosyltransferase involved in cell wall biosynthesis [Iodobacter fluviatilis]STR45489.1 lipopolysaccharide 1,2-N-acetylglucosaminetransferase [Iodobacter fluviatilis]